MNIRYPIYEGVYRILTNMHGIYHCSIRELSGSGRLFLYPSQPEMTRKEKGMDGKHRHWQTENYRAKLANASCRTARSGRKRFRKKSSSLRSGIFPENPAFPEAFAVGPL